MELPPIPLRKRPRLTDAELWKRNAAIICLQNWSDPGTISGKHATKVDSAHGSGDDFSLTTDISRQRAGSDQAYNGFHGYAGERRPPVSPNSDDKTSSSSTSGTATITKSANKKSKKARPKSLFCNTSSNPLQLSGGDSIAALTKRFSFTSLQQESRRKLSKAPKSPLSATPSLSSGSMHPPATNKKDRRRSKGPEPSSHAKEEANGFSMSRRGGPVQPSLAEFDPTIGNAQQSSPTWSTSQDFDLSIEHWDSPGEQILRDLDSLVGYSRESSPSWSASQNFDLSTKRQDSPEQQALKEFGLTADSSRESSPPWPARQDSLRNVSPASIDNLQDLGIYPEDFERDYRRRNHSSPTLISDETAESMNTTETESMNTAETESVNTTEADSVNATETSSLDSNISEYDLVMRAWKRGQARHQAQRPFDHSTLAWSYLNYWSPSNDPPDPLYHPGIREEVLDGDQEIVIPPRKSSKNRQKSRRFQAFTSPLASYFPDQDDKYSTSSLRRGRDRKSSRIERFPDYVRQLQAHGLISPREAEFSDRHSRGFERPDSQATVRQGSVASTVRPDAGPRRKSKVSSTSVRTTGSGLGLRGLLRRSSASNDSTSP